MKIWCLVIFCLIAHANPAFGGELGDSLARKQEVIVVKKDFNKQQRKGQFELNVSYPVIETSIYPLTHDFNLNVQRIMGDAIHDFQYKVEQIHKKERGVNGLSILNLDYFAYFHVKEVVSIKFVKSTHYTGSPLPVELYLSLNYDLKNNRVIRLDDIFDTNTPYVQEITDLVNEQLKDCKIKEDNILRSFCLDDQALIITLDDQARNLRKCKDEVRIQWKDIMHLLNPNGLVQEIVSKRSP